MVELDGSQGEGGGQILRSSLALALLTGRPFHLRKVRARRTKPGLQPQHLMSVRAAAAIGQANLLGAALGSTDLVFEPGAIRGGNYHFPIGTAGATSLVLHTIYLPLTLRGDAASEVRLEGGTHVKACPCFHFLDTTWRAYLELMGIKIDVRMRRPGFYPRGGGAVEVVVHPCSRPRGLQLRERSDITRISGFSAVASLPMEIADRQARRARNRLEKTGLQVDIRGESWSGGPGTVLALVLDTRPVPTLFFGLGERGKRAERVADEAVDELLGYLERPGAVDPHSADQIVLPLALAEGPSSFSVSTVTMHLLTNIGVIGNFIDRAIVCHGAEGESGVVEIA